MSLPTRIFRRERNLAILATGSLLVAGAFVIGAGAANGGRSAATQKAKQSIPILGVKILNGLLGLLSRSRTPSNPFQFLASRFCTCIRMMRTLSRRAWNISTDFSMRAQEKRGSLLFGR